MARLRCLALAALPVLVAAALSSPSPAAAAYGCEERAAEAQERHAALVAWLASLGSQGAASLVAPSKRCGDGPPEAAKALTEGDELLAVRARAQRRGERAPARRARAPFHTLEQRLGFTVSDARLRVLATVSNRNPFHVKRVDLCVS